jgi:succinate dehydrogenase / fumarate reductase cytochrome b subunit
MSTRVKFLASSVGTKLLIAITGLSLFLFLVVHLIGNLMLFVGPETFNAYSHALISNPLIYVAEAGLLALLLLHVFNTVLNWWSNRGARPEDYEVRQWAGHTSRKSVASTSMILTGAVTLVFVVFHLATMKYGPAEAQGYIYVSKDGPIRDLHRLVIEVFRDNEFALASVAFYVVCMVLVFLHLRHGVSSALQSLGVNHPRYNRFILMAGTALAIVIGFGFAVIPVIVYLGGGRS